MPKFNKWLNLLLDGYDEMLVERNPCNNKEYYQFIVAWIKKYKFLMKKELEVYSDIEILLNLDVDKYVLEETEYFSLEDTKRRLFSDQFKKVRHVISLVRSVLYDLITIYSDVDCPCCKDNYLRYLVRTNNKDEELVLCCPMCSWCQDLVGNQFAPKEGDSYIPATKEQLAAMSGKDVAIKGGYVSHDLFR